MPPARFRRSALAGCALLGACNDTSDLAPASPDTPWQFEPSKEAKKSWNRLLLFFSKCELRHTSRPIP